MMQSFQCSVCGRQNAFGEPACAQCGQAFIYNCPICGSHINNRYDKCRGCGAAFNWGAEAPQNTVDSCASPAEGAVAGFQSNTPQNAPNYFPTPAMPISPAPAPNPTPSPATNLAGTTRRFFQPDKGGDGSIFSGPRLWVILIIVSAVLIAILLVVDRLVSK
jgi:hypothetical protein